ncbi:MAG TPA: hypothetical protein PK020_11260 [Ilumatobacteraceae bacterium]|nr:hypothetical protein [Ilumatobacteraceae bacterium]HRB03670.1 hypothetical protein [Ilumatobacteraceae bacterium]
MKIHTRIAIAGAVLFGAIGVAGAPQAQAAPRLVPHPGDGSAAIFITAAGTPGLTNGYTYNSSGGGVTVGQTDATHFWVSFQSMGGGAYTNTQLTIWNGAAGPSIDPVCTVDRTSDARGNLTVWFQCTPFPTNTLVGSQLFVNVTNRTHADPTRVRVPGFIAVTTASPSAASETPTNQYRSSGTGLARVTRTALGRYTVTVPSAAYASGQGVAFATALTVSPTTDPSYTRYCNPQGWYPSGTDMIVDVACFMGIGSAADAPFSLRLTTHDLLGGTRPGGSQWVSNPASAGYTAATYGWNSASGTNFVRSLATWEGAGVSSTQWNGTTYAAGKVPSLLVSGYGGNQRCTLEYHGYHPTGLYTNATVRCYDPSGGAGSPNGRYTVGLVQL